MQGFHNTPPRRSARTRRKPPRAPRLVAPIVVLAALISGGAAAQTVTNYSYDSLQRLTGATTGSGGIQYSYDANGNLTSITRTSSSSLSPNQPLDVNLNVPGQSASFTFSVTGDGNAAIYLNSISTSPPGSSVSVSVYNSSGALVSSTSGTTNATLSLGGLPVGTYTVVLTPPSSSTASLQVNLAVAAQPDMGDAPLPTWMYLMLALGLLAGLARTIYRSRNLRLLCVPLVLCGLIGLAHAQTYRGIYVQPAILYAAENVPGCSCTVSGLVYNYTNPAGAISAGEQGFISENAGYNVSINGSPFLCANAGYINGTPGNWCVSFQITSQYDNYATTVIVATSHEFCPQSTSTVTWIEEQEGSTTINGQANQLAICHAVVPVIPQTPPDMCNETAPCSDGSGGTGGGFGNPIFGEDGTKRQAETDYSAPNGLLTFRRLYRSDRGGFYNNFQSAVSAPVQLSTLTATPSFLPSDCSGGTSTSQIGQNSYFYVPCFVAMTPGTTGEIDITTPAGNVDQFTWSGSTASPVFSSTVDHLSQATQNGSTVWVWARSREGLIETYNTNWQLLSRQYLTGQSLSFTYSDGSTPSSTAPGVGYLIAVTSTFGRQLSLTYDASGRLSTMTNPDGGVTRYGYADPDPGAQTPCGPGGCSTMASVTYPDGSERQYLWNETSDIANAAQNAPALLTGIVDESGQRFATFTYNGLYATSTQHAGGVDEYAFSGFTPYQQVSVTDPLGTQRTYQYTSVAGLVEPQQQTQPAAAGSGTAASTFSYDSNGNPQAKSDFNGNTTCYLYDTTRNFELVRLEGLPAGMSCPANLNTYQPPSGSMQRLIWTSWHPNWPLPVEKAEPGLTTTWVYNGQPDPTDGGATASCAPSGAVLNDGEPLVVLCKLIEEATTDTTGGAGFYATSQAGIPDRIWQWTYNSNGQVVSATDPRGNVTSYTYYGDVTGTHALGDLETVKNAAGNVTTYDTYDPAGRLLTATDANGVVTTFIYDGRGRLTSRSVGGETTSFSYYPTGLLEQVTLPDGSSLSYTYDAAHRLTQLNDGLGNKIVYSLDSMGNRVAENSYDASGTLFRTHTRVINALDDVYQEIDAAGTPAVTTTFGYDNDGNQTSINAPLNENTVQNYDTLNRLIAVQDPGGGSASFGYDGEDDLTTVTDPRTLGTSYSYDGLGDLTSQTSPDTGTTTNTYDAAGNLSTSTDARGAVATYGYDALNRVTSIAYSLSGNTDQTLAFTYDQGTDGIGRLTGASDANHSMRWSYDPQGRVTQMTQTVGGVAKTVQYGYTNGDLTSLTTPSGQMIGYQYPNHRISAITVNGSPLVSGVTYAPFGPVTGWQWASGSSVSRTYDGDGRVTSSTTGGYTASYSYYADGTLESTTEDAPAVYSASSGATTVAVASGSNQIASLSGTTGGSYQYDAAGDLLSDGTRTFTYNDAGRLATATNDGITTTYRYNALGERIEKSSSNGTTYFVYDEAGHLLGEYDAGGNLIEELVWLNDTPVASLRPNPSGSGIEILYIDTDFLNAPTALVSATSGKVVWRWDHDPYGNGAALEEPSNTGTDTVFNLRFPGQYYDQETGLMHNAFRDYDPTVGRYLESDPMGLYGGSYSPYVYASGDPIIYIDPFGLCWIYSQSTGQLTHVDANGHVDYTVGGGYSGYGIGLNNPALQFLKAFARGEPVGPIPQGTYTIGPPHYSANTGPITMNLTPVDAADALGRTLLRIHGDNPKHNHTASSGCIVEGPNVRSRIAASHDTCLKVIP